MGGGGYIPRFRNLIRARRILSAGYAYDFGSGGTPPAKHFPLYGEALLKELTRAGHTAFSLTTMGTVLPRHEHHVRIDPHVKDEWGIPSLHITQRYTDNEFAMAQDSMNVAEELCRDAGFEMLEKHPEMVPPAKAFTNWAPAGWATTRRPPC